MATMQTQFLLAATAICLAASSCPAPGQTNGAKRLTNFARTKDDWPVSLPKLQRPAVSSILIFEPCEGSHNQPALPTPYEVVKSEDDWKYSHHQSLVAFKNKLLAIWSSSSRDEDSPGQRVMFAVRSEKGEWNRPRILFQPDIDPDGRLRILTAAGFHEHDGTLAAYAGDYSIDRKSTRLLARTTRDGKLWSEVRDLHVPVCPNHGPQKTASGRLIIAGNTAFPYTDDPAGLTGWKMAGIYPASLEPFQDNPSTFWNVAKCMQWPNLCEGAFYQTGDRVLHMLLRCTDPAKTQHPELWETCSSDDGATWSAPHATAFSNTDTKFHFGRLPDGRFYCVGNPIGYGRIPLVLSTSRDGVRFDRHYLLGDKPYQKRFEGRFKGGHYSYPHSIVHDGQLYVIVARQKESIEVLNVALSELRESD